MIDRRVGMIGLRISHWIRLTLTAAVLACGMDAYGAQSSLQQRCINDLNKRGSEVARQQGKSHVNCILNAGRGTVSKLGTPPQEQTAQACLTNDVGGAVAKRTQKITDRDADRCLADAGQMPDFGYAGASAVNAGTLAASRGIVDDLFGSDLDTAIVLDHGATGDPPGAKCQREVLKRTNRVLDDMWKEVLRQKKGLLRGRDRRTGTDPLAPVDSGAELAAEIPLFLQDDPRGKVAKAIDRLKNKTVTLCTAAATPVPDMFPGVCAGAATLTDLAACTASRAQAHFYNSFATVDAVAVDCDMLDDGAANGTCVAPALAQHVLDRTGYGPDAWSFGRITTLGVEGYIQEQLSPETIDDSALEAALTALPSLTMSFSELRTNYPQGGDPGRNEVRRELQIAKMARAIASRRQLTEILVDFWFNHFNVDATSSGRTQWDISPYDRIAIRPHVLGRFEDLLVANARSPAMGDYLDNRRSRVNAINENYGRELMELHTLGVDGGFTEFDVVNVSRCFTGWREDYDNDVDGFEFRASWHDQGSKSLFLGDLVIPAGGGEQDGLDVIAYLASCPQTAAFLSRKLVIRFINENPPESLVAAATATYLATDGDLRAVMETILLSPEFLQDPTNRRVKVKRPHHLLASAARALGADPAQIDFNNLRQNARDMGESLYEAGPPTGYPDVSGFWTSPGTLITRFNEIERRARGRDGFVFTYPVSSGASEEIVDALIAMLLPGGVSPDTRDTAIALADALVVTDARRVEQTAALLMSSPEFLQH